MNYEESYKKAIERAIEKIETYNRLGNASVVKSFYDVFPELRESEDERIRKELIEFIRHGNCVFDSLEQKNRFWAWLEKQGEKTAEWSEEDERIQENCIEYIKVACLDREESNECINWLKSIKPNHWKPSKEQMNELRKVAFQFGNSCLSPYSDENKKLVSLYNDLKKL